MNTGLPNEIEPDLALNANREHHVARLRWRCRRGMKELDQLLVRYLETHYQTAMVEQQEDFEALLEVEDDRLWRWVIGLEKPSSIAFETLLRAMI